MRSQTKYFILTAQMRMGHLRIYEIDYKLKTMWDGGVKLSFPHPLHTALVGRIAQVFELDLHSNLKYTCAKFHGCILHS